MYSIFKSLKKIINYLSFIIIVIIFFSLLFITRDDKLINNIKDFVEKDEKILYISNEKKYKNYPIKLFKKYDIDYLYVDSTNISKVEKKKIQKIINSTYLNNIIVIFNNGEVVDAIIDYKDEESLLSFLQSNLIIPEKLGDNSKILDNVNSYLETDLTLLYLPYYYNEENDLSEKLKFLSENYDFEYKEEKAYYLSKNQKNKLNKMLQISDVKDQIIILIKDKKIIGSIRDEQNVENILDKLIEYKFVKEKTQKLININYDNYLKLKSDGNKNIILLTKENCKECDELEDTLNELLDAYNINIFNYNIESFDSDDGKIVKESLKDMEYNDAYTAPMVLIIESDKILDYSIGPTKYEYFEKAFKENGIIK